MATLSHVDTSASPFSVAVVDDDPKLRTRLAMQLGERARAAAFSSLGAVEEKIRAGSPLVIVLGPSFAKSDLHEVTRIIRARTDAIAVMVVHELDGGFAASHPRGRERRPRITERPGAAARSGSAGVGAAARRAGRADRRDAARRVQGAARSRSDRLLNEGRRGQILRCDEPCRDPGEARHRFRGPG